MSAYLIGAHIQTRKHEKKRLEKGLIMISTQDRIVGICEMEKQFEYVNDDKRTKICASDIAQYFDEYYPELFETIASDDKAYASFKWLLETSTYFSFAELAADYMADNDNMNNYSSFNTLAHNFGYDTFDEFEYYSDANVFCDSALDGFIVMGY